MNPKLKILKNFAISGTVGIATAAGVSELADLIMENDLAISITATATHYISYASTFYWLHYYDTKHSYMNDDKKVESKKMLTDLINFSWPFIAVEIGYVIGRTWLQKKFQDAGYDHYCASICTDTIFGSAYLGLALPVAKFTGILKKYKKLD